MATSHEQGIRTCLPLRVHLAVLVFFVLLLLPSLSAFPPWQVRERAQAQESSDYLSLENPTDRDIDALGDRPITHLEAYLGNDENGLSLQGVRRLLNRKTLVDVFISARRTNINEVIRSLPSSLRHFATFDTLRDPQLALIAQLSELKTLVFQFNGTEQGMGELRKLRLVESVNIIGFGSGRRVCDTHYAATLCEWKKLRSLRLASVNVGNLTFAALAALENLREIELQSVSSVTVADLALLSKAPALTRLFLGSCDALNDSVWTVLPEYEGLNTLELQDCPAVNPVLLHELGKCSALSSLSIVSTSIRTRKRSVPFVYILEHAESASIARPFGNLAHLNLKNQNGLDDAAFRYIIQANQLESLDINDCCSLNAESLLALSGHAGLQELAACRMPAFTSSVLLTLVETCALIKIRLTYIQGFDDAVARALGERGRCSKLTLHSCRSVSGEGMLSLAEMQSLELLNIMGYQGVTPDLCRALARLPHLKVLNLSESDISDDGIQKLAKSDSLTIIGLHYCTFSEHAVSVLLKNAPIARIGVAHMAVESIERLRLCFPGVEFVR